MELLLLVGRHPWGHSTLLQLQSMFYQTAVLHLLTRSRVAIERQMRQAANIK